ncbi:hypothetical protein BMF94_1900 [Rhodotorula taiwanensis]|uniref:AAA+ ATPase domain-containing protein n=1 Tax=Rhodotorula taiwanensis TaxID=741276 RepID=A0A2S5BDS4_9BASI|nr:hypothetical protein BMF94_1900 [Rhodotorula taiwanensis]
MPKASPSKKKPTKSATQFSISSFLPAAPQPRTTSKTGSKLPKQAVEREDDRYEVVLSDDDPSDEFKRPVVPRNRVKPAAATRKPTVLDLTADDDDIQYTGSSSPAKPATKSKKFEKGKGKAKDPSPEDDDSANDAQLGGDDQLWVDKYAPATKDDLSIHPKKLADVENWFSEAFNPLNPKLAKYRRVLVLSGPAGAGKTAVVRMLAKEKEAEVIEWKEGHSGRYANDDTDRESLVHRFTSFLARAGMAPALDFGPDPTQPTASTSSSSQSQKSFFPPPPRPVKQNSRRLILLEDLPNVSHYPTKLALRSAVQQYLASPRVTAPLVIIISEALARPGDETGGGAGWLSGNGRRGESIDARSVLGVEILNSPACREIAFNPIAATIMRKALNRTLDRIYASDSSTPIARSSRPSTATLDLLIAHSSGDIRSALMNLQFLASESSEEGGMTSLGTGARGSAAAKGQARGKGKKRKRDEESSEDEGQGGRGKATGKDKVKKLLQFVTARESSLFIFHALGKVLYNKRWGQSADDDKKDLGRPGIVQDREYDRLPKHLRNEWDRAATKVDPDAVFAEAPLDTDIFLTYLHHNYPPFTNSIEECSRVVDALSAAESLMSVNAEGEEGYRRLPLTSLYGFQIAVRGTLLSLPSPVPRRRQVLRKSELWDNLRLQRQNEEGVDEVMGLERRRAMARMALGGEGTQRNGGSRDGEGTLGASGGMGELKKTMLCETVAWLGVIKPKDYHNAFLLDLATFPPLDGPEQDLLTGATLGEKETSLEEVDEGVMVDTSSGGDTPRGRRAKAGRSALQEVEQDDDEEVGTGVADDLAATAARRAKDAAFLFDPEDDIDDV